jgi:hypothetical protein
MNSNQLSSRSAILAVILLFAGVFFRVARADLAPEVLPNFSPLMAAALCGAVFIPGWLGLVVPVVALLVSDAALNTHYGEPVISPQLLWTLPCYLIAVGIGWLLREQSERRAPGQPESNVRHDQTARRGFDKRILHECLLISAAGFGNAGARFAL